MNHFILIRANSIRRLVRGSGEIIEEIVSKDRQKEINRVNLFNYKFIAHKFL